MSEQILSEVQQVAAYTLLVGHPAAPSVATSIPRRASDDGGAFGLGDGGESGLDDGRSLPGGRVRHGEAPADTAVRTVRRQLGVDVTLTGLRGAFADVANDTASGASVHTVRIVYEAHVRGPADPVPDRAGPESPDSRTADVVPGRPGSGRPDPGPPRVQRPGAYALVVHDDRILLSRYVGDGRWSLPGGGIDHGEQPVAALHREVREETGLRLTGARLLDVDSMHFTGHSPRGEVQDFHAVRIIYLGTVAAGGRPQVLEVGGTTDAAAWFPIADLDGVEITSLVRRVLRLRG